MSYLLNEWSSEDIERLKEQNDWNQPLDHSKMTSRNNKVTLDGYLVIPGDLDYSEIKQACCDKFGIDQASIRELCVLDMFSEQTGLCWLCFDGSSGEECHFVIVDHSYDLATLRTERTTDSLAELQAFKQNNT